MAIKKQIDIQVNTKEAINNLEALGGKFEQVYGEGVEPLTTQISELEDRLYAMSQAGEAGSAEFKEISKSIASMKKTIISTDMDIDAMTDSLSTNLGGALSGVAGGFSFVQGAMGAMGADSDKLESTLLAVNSAMAMVQGVEGMKMGIRAFKGLKASIMATSVAQKLFGEGTKVATVGMRIFNAVVNANPIFLLITAITAVVGAFAWLMSDSEDLTASTENLNAAYEQLTASMDRVNDRRKALADTQMRILKATGASEEELRATRLKNLKDDEKARLEDLALQKAVLEEGRELYKKAKEAEDDEAARAAKETIQKARDKYHTLKNMEGQFQASILEEIQSGNEEIKAEAEKRVKEEEQRQAQRVAKYKEFLKDKETARKLIEDLTNKAIEDDREREIAQARTQHEREIQNIVGTEEQKNQIKILKADELEKKLAEIKAKYREEEIPLRKQADLTEETANIDAAVAKRKTEEQTQKYLKEYDEEEAQRKRDLADQRLSLASDTFGALGDLATAFAKDDEKSAERAFKVNKAVGIAQAVISTAQGVMAQLSVPQDALTGANFVKAGIVAATGAAQIATIAKSKFQGGAAGSSPTAPSGSVSTPSSQPASFNVVGNSGVNQLAETLGNQGQQPIQAFVVGSEVTTQQSLDRNKVETATL